MTTTPTTSPCTTGHDLVDVTGPDASPHVRVFGCPRCGRGMPGTQPLGVAAAVEYRASDLPDGPVTRWAPHDEQVADAEHYPADPPMPLGIAVLLALAGAVVMLLGLLSAVWVATPLNGFHLLAAILVACGGAAFIVGMHNVVAHVLPDEDGPTDA